VKQEPRHLIQYNNYSTGWTTGIRFLTKTGSFYFWKHVQTGSGNHPDFYSIDEGAKRPRREVDHLHPSSAKVKNAWSYTSIPPYVFTAW